LVIAGPGTHSPEYVAEIARLAEQDERVRVLGPQYGGEKAWLLHNGRVFVQPSSIEGLPIALLEALAAGCFPVVSEIPENLEPVTVDGSRFGISFPVGNERALANALQAAIDHPDRSKTGQRLRDHVRREYDWHSIARRTEAIYRDVRERSSIRPRRAMGGSTSTADPGSHGVLRPSLRRSVHKAVSGRSRPNTSNHS
jgi:glycosyltransferase involved in cell wall biosynthesis